MRGGMDIIIDDGLHTFEANSMFLDGSLKLLKPGGFFLLSCFSMHFKHHPQERRTRDWLVHQGHYDRFFKRGSFKKIFGETFEILQIEEERQSLYAFYHVLMRRKMSEPPAPAMT